MFRRRLQRKWNLFKRSVKAAYFRLNGNQEYQKFVVITRSRSGSTLLMSLLKSHPQVQMYGEEYQYLHGGSSSSLWNQIFGYYPSHIRAVGFKIFYYHPLDNNKRDVWQLIQQNPDIKVIHLIREDMLEVHVSRQVAGLSGQWNSQQKKKTVDQIELDFEVCLEDFERTSRWIAETNESFGDKMYAVRYEALVQDTPGTMRRLFKYLGIPAIEVSTNLRKQNQKHIRNLISNFEEVKQKFKGTEWESLFTKM